MTRREGEFAAGGGGGYSSDLGLELEGPEAMRKPLGRAQGPPARMPGTVWGKVGE